MNPPSAIHGAMSRDRKPFTYTPGGLDLSEIKSERMAKRLMRNAMNQGVPETPSQPIQSPPMPSTPILVPNFNCLPVQVFPTFNLPVNPKSLLRTRSNPDPPKEPIQRVQPPPSFTNNNKEIYEPFNRPTASHTQTNNRPASLYEYVNNPYELPQANNGCFKNPYELPEISYDAEYFTSPPPPKQVSNEPFISFQNDYSVNKNGNHTDMYSTKTKPVAAVDDPPIINFHDNNKDKETQNGNPTVDSLFTKSTAATVDDFASKAVTIDDFPLIRFDNDDKSEKTHQNGDNGVLSTKTAPEVIIQHVEGPVKNEVEEVTTDDKKQVKFVKKTVKKEENTEEQNGDHNGDVEAEMTLTLPTKKSAAKTETKVEVVTKTLPDGSTQEIKTTITKTTIDGKTEIKTQTETKTIPKEETDEEEEIEEEVEENGEVENVEEVEEQIIEEPKVTIKEVTKEKTPEIQEDESNIIKGEEKSETTTTTTRKVVVLQTDNEDSKDVEEEEEVVEEEEEIEETEPVTVVIKKTESSTTSTTKSVVKEEEVEEEEIEEETVEEPEPEEKEIEKVKPEETENESQNEEVETEEAEEKVAVSIKKTTEVEQTPASDEEEEIYEEAEEKEVEETKTVEETEEPEEPEEENEKSETIVEVEVLKPTSKEEDEEIVEISKAKDTEVDSEVKSETKEETLQSPEPVPEAQEREVEVKVERKEENEPEFKPQVPLREPSVPLEKVEDVEIKPIGPAEVITKTHTEKTEIITQSSPVPGVLSTQTEYNRIEKIETVNRTTKTLDGPLDDPISTEIPIMKTYFPQNRDRVLASPMLSRPFQSAYTPEPATERRHSLLLERLSVDRQMPSEIYHNQTTEQQQQQQWNQEPQSEVLTISNVKPSSITNQQWYQQTRETSVYNEPATAPVTSTPIWSQTPKPAPLTPQPQPTYRPQPTYPSQPAYTPQPSQQTYSQPPPQQSYTPQPQQKLYTPQPTQRAFTPQPTTPILQPQYQPTYTEERSSNTYTSYTPKPTWASNIDSTPTPTINVQQPSPYSYTETDNYQQTTQQYSSSYVPPPWEQDSSYVVNNSQNYYQPPPTSTLTPTATPTQSWKPPVPKNKFTKPPPTAYIPPAPNQSFVKPVHPADPPKLAGRKTYYSEYERRYITVPESNYIPTETKFQAQPDPSPQYYYDSNEQSEPVEHQWRKELREFTEKSQTQTEQTSVKPPWESESKYTKTVESTYSSTPTWSQTLRPRSWRERSFEREFTGSQEWPKTNTLGRSRPLSSYTKNEPIVERTRGVSVDRYNPNNYQSPSSLEHPPVQSHTLNPQAPHGNYHNPTVPGYHSRASTETREQSHKQPRVFREPKPTPVQSRSFKYLQWITGTED